MRFPRSPLAFEVVVAGKLLAATHALSAGAEVPRQCPGHAIAAPSFVSAHDDVPRAPDDV